MVRWIIIVKIECDTTYRFVQAAGLKYCGGMLLLMCFQRECVFGRLFRWRLSTINDRIMSINSKRRESSVGAGVELHSWWEQSWGWIPKWKFLFCFFSAKYYASTKCNATESYWNAFKVVDSVWLSSGSQTSPKWVHPSVLLMSVKVWEHLKGSTFLS